jgi:hypothetical protein
MLLYENITNARAMYMAASTADVPFTDVYMI